jgi:hypothetical protein
MRTKTMVALIAILALIVLLVPAKSAVVPAVASQERVNIAHSEAVSSESVLAEKARIAAIKRADRIKARKAAEAKRILQAKQKAQEDRRARERARAAAPASRKKASRTYAVKSIASDSGTNRRIGKAMAAKKGWSGVQWTCLNNLWTKESGWRTEAVSRSGKHHGIPQLLSESLRGASAEYQVQRGLSYIAHRYGNPCKAWGHFQRNNWY